MGPKRSVESERWAALLLIMVCATACAAFTVANAQDEQGPVNMVLLSGYNVSFGSVQYSIEPQTSDIGASGTVKVEGTTAWWQIILVPTREQQNLSDQLIYLQQLKNTDNETVKAKTIDVGGQAFAIGGYRTLDGTQYYTALFYPDENSECFMRSDNSTITADIVSSISATPSENPGTPPVQPEQTTQPTPVGVNKAVLNGHHITWGSFDYGTRPINSDTSVGGTYHHEADISSGPYNADWSITILPLSDLAKYSRTLSEIPAASLSEMPLKDVLTTIMQEQNTTKPGYVFVEPTWIAHHDNQAIGDYTKDTKNGEVIEWVALYKIPDSDQVMMFSSTRKSLEKDMTGTIQVD